MKFYVTTEGTAKLKRSFLNLKLYAIINIEDILEENGYKYETLNEYEYFIVAKKIMALIKNYTKSKRIKGIIYSNPYLNHDIIENILETISEFEKITSTVLFDEYNVSKHEQYYHMFDEIIFYPSTKKIRLIECQPIPSNVNWKP